MALVEGSVRELTNARPMDVQIVDANGDPIVTFTSAVAPPSSATLTSVPSSITSVSLLAANPNRRKFIIVNAGTKTLYVAFAATATTSAYTFIIPANGSYESEVNDYTGDISGIWNALNGAAKITEITV